MTRVERLAREREEHINSVRIYTDMLAAQSSFGESFIGEDETFRASLRETIAADVQKIREISREIGPVRPLHSDKKHHD